VDSIKAQVLLSEEDYLLERLRGGPAQKTIHAFKQVTAQPLGEDIIYPAARPTLGRLQQQQAQAEKLHQAQAQEQVQQPQDQPPRPPQYDAARVAEPSCSAGDAAAAAATHVATDREPSGNAAEHDDEDAEQGDGVTAIHAAPEQTCQSAAVSGKVPHRNQSDKEWGLAEEGASAVAAVGRSSTNDDAGSQYGTGDAVSELHPVPEPRQAAAAATWTPEDMRVAQAAAATARSRCDMLKVRGSIMSTQEHASTPRSSPFTAVSTAPSCTVSPK